MGVLYVTITEVVSAYGTKEGGTTESDTLPPSTLLPIPPPIVDAPKDDGSDEQLLVQEVFKITCQDPNSSPPHIDGGDSSSTHRETGGDTPVSERKTNATNPSNSPKPTGLNVDGGMLS